MGLITQTSPIIVPAVAGISSEFTAQITVSGGVGAVTFTTTNPNQGLSASTTGAVVTTGELLDGTYTIGGTVADFHGNSGTWVLTVNVVGSSSPQVSVTPVQAAMPNQSEILVPFQIDPATGGIAQITDYLTIIAQHVETILMTAPGERVMNPGYGVGLENYTFEPVNGLQLSTLQGDIAAQIQALEPTVIVQNVTITPNQSSPNVLTVTVAFSVIPFNEVSTVTVSTGGPITQVSA